jgi:hypothetical protein
MTPFEYVIVLISIILGLGITTILTGLAELIKHTRPVRLYTPYIIWIILIFVLHIQDWWYSYHLKSVDVWSLHFFLLIIIYPINLYILAHLLFPSGLTSEFDSKQFYLDHHPRLFIGVITLVIISVVQNIVVFNLAIATQALQVVLLLVMAIMLIAKVKNSAVHTLVAFLLLAMMIIGFALDSENLIIK